MIRVPLITRDIKKNNAWKEISKKLGIEKTEVKTRYSNIRTKFSKYIKKRRSLTSGFGRCDMPLIRDELEHPRWLLPHITHRQSIGNLSEDTSLCSLCLLLQYW